MPEVTGIFDPIVDKQYERKVRQICTAERFTMVISDFLHRLDASGSQVGQFIADFIKGNEMMVADALAAESLALLLGDHSAMMAGPDGVGPLMMMRFHRQGYAECAKQHPTFTLKQCREKVHAEWTPERVSEAIRQTALSKGNGVEGIGDWFQWLMNHWDWKLFLEIALSLLPFLL